MRPYSRTTYVVPGRNYYRPYYTRWYVHPYYRHVYATNSIVGFSFDTNPWNDRWSPPARAGWSWRAGYWNRFGYWCPGYWEPRRQARVPNNYTYVPGWWDDGAYVDGYYRQNARSGWRWRDGYYDDQGEYSRGHWKPEKQAPEGYTWEAGFWDGETWVEGFWRPEFRSRFTWVSAYYDEDNVFHGGYWMPTQQRSGETWVPGWFDGNAWQKGYWENAETYRSADVSNWAPEDGWGEEGWEAGMGWGDGEVVSNNQVADDTPPIALPVVFDESDLADVIEDENLPPM